MHEQHTQWCPICDQPMDACPVPLGAHLLCPPTAECRHELCQLLAGDVDSYPPIALPRKAAS